MLGFQEMLQEKNLATTRNNREGHYSRRKRKWRATPPFICPALIWPARRVTPVYVLDGERSSLRGPDLCYD